MRILTIDVEEWFHILDNYSTKTHQEWKNYEGRIHRNMSRIFSILESTNTKATFFCLGWIAETYPDVVREIVARGYEIGTHSQMHQLVYEQTPAAFEQDLIQSLDILENITGKKVKYYRAPGFSITEKEKWAFEVLIKHGIEVDSSVFPAPRAHGGFPCFGYAGPSIIQYNGISLKELPINYKPLGKFSLIFSGGGYFRLFPYSFINRWSTQADYLMCYMHPRDFDPDQPMINELSLIRKFKSYYGLKQAEGKFEKWLLDFKFTDIQEAIDQIDWQGVPVVEL